MANQLSVVKVHSILTLHAGGWSQRRIAAELGIDRETVARYVHMARAEAEAKPATRANAPPPRKGRLCLRPQRCRRLQHPPTRVRYGETFVANTTAPTSAGPRSTAPPAPKQTSA